jgi:hypothetical protein
MIRTFWSVALLAAVAGSSTAAELNKVERRIEKEPAYASKAPRYALLVLGPGTKDRVWLVKDGNVLYVDRNGNGDLTEPGEKVAAKKGSSAEEGYHFEADDLNVGGRKHYRLGVSFYPLKRMMVGENARRPEAVAILKQDPGAETFHVRLDVTAPHLKAKGQVMVLAGGFDLNGPLVPAKKPGEAPIIHLCGPLEINFTERRPVLRRNRVSEFMLAVGTRGLGAGTFAAIGYNEVIPDSVRPKCEITFPPARAGGQPVKKQFELKERC